MQIINQLQIGTFDIWLPKKKSKNQKIKKFRRLAKCKPFAYTYCSIIIFVISVTQIDSLVV